MNTKINNFIIFDRLTLIIIVLSFLFNNFIQAQVNDNLSQIYFLADSSVAEILKTDQLDRTDNFIDVIAPKNYKLIKNRVLFSFGKNGITSAPVKTTNRPTIIYSIDKAGVNYPDMFRDGWFGDYMVKRQTYLKASLRFSNNEKYLNKDINYSIIDTVNLDKIKTLENPTLPFTHGDVPDEPLFSSLLEPFIAIGTVVVTVLLLFNVRSK